MTESVCEFCGVTDKQRCKTPEKTFNCDNYKNAMKLKAVTASTANVNPKTKVNNKMSKTSEQLADLSGRTARSTIAFIDAMAARGAYKGEELQTIGQLRQDAAQVVQLAEAVQTETKAEEPGKK